MDKKLEGIIYSLFIKDPSCNAYLEHREREKETLTQAHSAILKLLLSEEEAKAMILNADNTSRLFGGADYMYEIDIEEVVKALHTAQLKKIGGK